MSILTSILGLDRRAAGNPEDPTVPLTSQTLVDWLGVSSRTEAGISVTHETAMRFTAVFRAVALLAGLVGSLPLSAYKREGQARVKVDSPIIDDPNPDKTVLEVWEYAMTSLLLDGNSFSLKLFDGLGRVRELWGLNPNAVRVDTRDRLRSDRNPRGRFYEVHDGSRNEVYEPDEIMHVSWLSLDGLRGLSPIGHARQAIALGLAAEKAGAKMFGSGMMIPGIITTEGELDDEDAMRLRKRWRKLHGGTDNAGDVAVLDSGATFTPVSITPADAQFLESRSFSVTEIARLYGLPPHLLADVERSTSWGSGIEQQNLAMLIFTLQPWLTRIEQRLTKELLPAGRYAKWNVDAILRADSRARAEFYSKLRQWGILRADEAREKEELEPLGGKAGEGVYRPQNMELIVPGQEDAGGEGGEGQREQEVPA